MKSAGIIVAVVIAASGCASVSPPPGQEESKSFTQESTMMYKDAYRLISKQMRSCYRVIGVFGNGYEIQSELDTEQKEGRVELYHVGATGADKFEDSMFSRIVTIKEHGKGSVINTIGTTTNYTYRTHQAIKGWLRGNDNCAPVKD